MENFGQLLNQYVQRAGISDAELARTIGVSRQTIFRWREGMTARPRYREDVLTIVRKLRLTPEERDRLLLAAGFRPEAAEEPGSTLTDTGKGAEEVGDKRSEAVEEQAGDAQAFETTNLSFLQTFTASPYRWWLVAVASVLLIGVTAWWINSGQWGGNFKDAPTREVVVDTNVPTNLSSTKAAIPPEHNIDPPLSGETLVLVTHFANYASSQVGYNVAGRLSQALQREIDNVRLEDIRLAIWPEPVGERHQALQVGQAVSATLVIYGEYDVGRVMVHFAYPADQSTFADPALQHYVADVQELSAAINSDLPQQVRSLALMALGQIYLNQAKANEARPLLLQARDNLKNAPAVEAKTWALVNFYLGLAYHHSDPPDLDQAITAYTQAMEVWPEMLSSRLNRSVAYQARGLPDDLELAMADIERVIEDKPDWAEAYNNRASIRLHMGGNENQALALADLEKALTLNPDMPAAYFNRAYVSYKQNKPMDSLIPDLEQALALRPDYATAFNLFCWGYALEQQAELALPYCQQAVEIDPDPFFLDSRGLTYALLGDYPAAIADFRTYVDWLEEQPGEEWQQSLARRQAWIEALEAGENPFTPAVLAEIRDEFGQ